MQSRGVRGFSMIELMIALAIIGILATIAIPRYLSYRIRAMQVEAKANLAALHTAETAYYGEAHGYTDDLALLAWRPEGSPRFLYGFVSDATPAPSATNDTAELAAAAPVGFSTVNMVLASGIPLTSADLPAGTDCDASGFTLGAVANLDEDATTDLWTTNDHSNLMQTSNDATN